MKVSRWGGSLAVRLPKAVVDQLGLAEGDELDAEAIGSSGFRAVKRVERSPDEKARRAALVEEIKALQVDVGGREYRFDRNEMGDRIGGRTFMED